MRTQEDYLLDDKIRYFLSQGKLSDELLDELLLHLNDYYPQVSDIYLNTGQHICVKIRGDVKRIDRVLQPHDMTEFIKRIGKAEIAENLIIEGKPRDDSYIVKRDKESHENSILFRVNMKSCLHPNGRDIAISIVLRKLSPEPLDLEDTKFFIDLSEEMKQDIIIQKGLGLVVGETNSGKTTLLAAILRKLMIDNPIHLITVENPSEFNIAALRNIRGVATQIELGTNLPTAEIALKQILRSSPDVVLVGEVRSQEEVEDCFHIAGSVGGVYTTLHVNSASQAQQRMITLFPEAERDRAKTSFLLAANYVLYQRLYKTEDRRIPLREYWKVTEEDKLQLAHKDYTQWPQYIRRAMQEKGTDIHTTLERLRDNHYIKTVDFDLLTQQYSTGA